MCRLQRVKITAYALGWFNKTQFFGNQLLFHFLNLHVEKKTFAKAVACTMIFNTASSVNKFMKQRNEKSILTKKWNFEIFRIDEVVVNVNPQVLGFLLERLCK